MGDDYREATTATDNTAQNAAVDAELEAEIQDNEGTAEDYVEWIQRATTEVEAKMTGSRTG